MMNIGSRFCLKRGILLFEIILSLSLGTFFISMILDLYSRAEKSFYISTSKDQYINEFLDDTDSFPFLSNAEELTYKNFNITGENLGNFSILNTYSTNDNYGSLKLAKLFINNAGYDIDQDCSIYIAKERVMGSYEYYFYEDKKLKPIEDLDRDNISITPILLPISQNNVLTDFIVRNDKIFASADSNNRLDPDIFVFDISDTDNPDIISYLDTGPGVSMLSVNKNKIYTADASTVSQLSVLGIDENLTLSLLVKHSLVPPFATATLPRSSAIYTESGRVYIGTEKWWGDEFIVLDASDINNIFPIYSYNVESKVNHILKKEDKIFVSASGYDQLLHFTVSENGSDVSLESTFSPNGWSRQEGKVSNIFENDVLFGRTNGGFNISKDHELFVLDSTKSPAKPTQSSDILGGVYGIVSDKDFIYFGTKVVGKEFVIMDKNLSTSTALSIQLPVPVKRMKCYRDKIYVLGENVPVLYMIDFK